MLFGIFKLISRYSDKKEFYSILFYLFLSTILQYLLYIILPVLAFKLTSISLNNSENILNTNTNLKYFSEYFNFDLEKILYVTILLAISANIFSLYFIKKSALFSYKISSNIQIGVFKNYLYKKYSYFLNNAKSSSLNNIITDMFRLPAGIFIPYLQVISSLILSGLLIFTLFFVNFKISIIILLTIVIIYFQIFKFFRKKLYLTSVNISLSHKKIYEIVSYSLGLNKDVKIYNLENFINNKFSFLSKNLISTRSFANFISSSPKYIVETIAILFSMLAITIAYKSGKFNEEIILFFMFFGILSIKIIPAIQAVYVSLSIIQSNKSLMDNLPKINFNEFKFKNRINNFRRSIELKNVNFAYENNKNILSNINLKIKKGDTISIVGSNGSGKTTLINLISGFIKPSKGKIYYDEKVMSNGNTFGLFSILDPNPIFMNSNIYENICFKENITIKEKKKINEILRFVELSSKNLKKYNSENLEAKISQGEKQKIALARFLYFKKEFLIIDEGTTNLSSKLEFRLLQKIKKNYPNLTIIFITHRFVNLSFFNYIYEIKNHKLHRLKTYK